MTTGGADVGEERVERPGAQQWVPQRLSLSELRNAAQDCRGCELYEHATQAVVGDGPSDAPLMVVGEQPGDKEDQAGEPFVGPAGRLLDRALSEAGIDPETVFKTNVVKHFRFSGTRGKQRIHKSPSRVHIAACGPWLVAELELVKPTGVVLLGGSAGQAVYGSAFRVGKERGKLKEWPAEALVVPTGEGAELGAGTNAERRFHTPEWSVPTVHPSSVLRSRERDDDLAALVADLRVAAAALP